MDLGLTGKKALVTGGTRGVGRGVVLALARHGVDVMTCYRRGGAAVASLARELTEIGGRHHTVQADLAEPEQITNLLEYCRSSFGHLDLVVNNAGEISHAPYPELTLAEWQRIAAINLTAVHLVTSQAIPLLRPGGVVLSVGSKSVDVGIPACAHYTATKAALAGLHRSLAREFGARGIRFTVLSLGIIATEATEALPVEQREALIQRYSARTALGRLGTAAEVAGVVLWLASDLASYVTGASVAVDGGLS